MGRRQQCMQAGGDPAGTGMKLDGAVNSRHREGQAIGHQDDSLRRLIIHAHDRSADRSESQVLDVVMCSSEKNANK